MHPNIHSGTIYNSQDMEIASMSINTYMDKEDVVYTCARVLCSCSHVQLFATLWTVAHQIPLSRGFSSQGNWSGLPCPPSGNLPNPGIEPWSLLSPALSGGFFTTSTIWEAQIKYILTI